MPRKDDRSSRIVDAALKLAAERGWQRVSLADIAAACGMTVLQLHAIHRSKPAILAAFHRRLDAAMLAGAEDAEERPRDRVFEALMRRFDALAPHKPAVAAMAREAWGDPVASLCGGISLLGSMAFALEASGISAGGWAGRMRAKVLLGIYLSVVRVWLDDDTADMTRTMAALDRRLRRAESWLGLGGGASRSTAAEVA
jgi:AcrR family transcriptional regulator